jgi:hypothetical protein
MRLTAVVELRLEHVKATDLEEVVLAIERRAKFPGTRLQNCLAIRFRCSVGCEVFGTGPGRTT